VSVHLVGEAISAASIRARHLRHLHTRGVGKDDALPRDRYTILTVAGPALRAADETAALRDQQPLARRGVENILAYLSENRSGRSELIPLTSIAGITLPAITMYGEAGGCSVTLGLPASFAVTSALPPCSPRALPSSSVPPL
jgi:hypothetical protein